MLRARNFSDYIPNIPISQVFPLLQARITLLVHYSIGFLGVTAGATFTLKACPKAVLYANDEVLRRHHVSRKGAPLGQLLSPHVALCSTSKLLRVMFHSDENG